VVECSGNGHAGVAFAASATDACWGELETSCVPPSGASLPLGDTIVSCDTTDGSGNTSDCSVTMTVEDTLPPAIDSVTATPAVLWPPDHKWRRVQVNIEAADICAPTVTCAVVDVASSELHSGLGNGYFSKDSGIAEPETVTLRAASQGASSGEHASGGEYAKIVGPTTVKLRAARRGTGKGHIYTITVECRDDTGGNASRAATTVMAYHDARDVPRPRPERYPPYGWR